jgi:hypothetical protein
MAEKKRDKQQLVAISQEILAHHPEDVICIVGQGAQSLDWLGELFEMIQTADPERIKKLAQMGQHIAREQSGYLESMRDFMLAAGIGCGVLDKEAVTRLGGQ